MQVKLEKRHTLRAPGDAAWRALRDIHLLAECMPGAGINQQTGDNEYTGDLKVKVGPVQSIFSGTVQVSNLDDSNMTMALSAKGKDKSGMSNASMQLTASVIPIEANSCELVGNSEVKVMGKMASFGGRMINGVADQLINQFLANFSDRVLASGEGAAAAEAAQRVAAQPKQLNALSLMWAAVVTFCRRILGRKDST